MSGGGRSDQQDIHRSLLDHTDRIRALEATPTFFQTVTGQFILMEVMVAAVAANTATDVAFTDVFAAGNKDAVATSIPTPFANTWYSWDSGVDAHLVNVLKEGGYIGGLQCWFGIGAEPTVDFNAYVKKTGLGGDLFATPQPGILAQQKFFSAFNFSSPEPFYNAGIDYTKPYVFTPTQIGGGISFGIQIGHDHPVPLDCAVALMLLRVTND